MVAANNSITREVYVLEKCVPPSKLQTCIMEPNLIKSSLKCACVLRQGALEGIIIQVRYSETNKTEPLGT